jgi:Immunity protein Imm1
MGNMPEAVATIEWSEREPPLYVSTLPEIDRALDRIAAECPPDHPTIVVLKVNDHTLTLGLGGPESFIQVTESDDPPYIVTVGDTNAGGELTFFYQGEHHTEIPRRNLIPVLTARKVVQEFCATGQRAAITSWEEV